MTTNLPDVRLHAPPALLTDMNVSPGEWKVLVETTFPSARSAASVAMALSYCRARKLDIFKKPVHIVPMWSSSKGDYVETVWPGIAELRTTAFRTGQYGGIDEATFGDMVDETFTGKVKRDGGWKDRSIEVRFPEWCQVTVFRIVDGKPMRFAGPKVYWLESYARVGNTDLPTDMWCKRPRGQLEKVAEAAALRRAFPEEIGNDYAAEEMEGQRLHDDAAVASPEPPAPPPPPQVTHQKAEPEKKAEPAKRTGAAYAGEKAPVAEQKAAQVDHDAMIEDLRNDLTDCKTADDLEKVRVAYVKQIEASPPEYQKAAGDLWIEFSTPIFDREKEAATKAADAATEKDAKLLADFEAELKRCNLPAQVITTGENFKLEINQAAPATRDRCKELFRVHKVRTEAELKKVQDEAAKAASDEKGEGDALPPAPPEPEGGDGESTSLDPSPPAPPGEGGEEEAHVRRLYAAAKEKAKEGSRRLRFHLGGLHADDRDLLRPFDKELFAEAAKHDEKA